MPQQPDQLDSRLYKITTSLELLAVGSDDEDEDSLHSYDKVTHLNHSFIIPPPTRRRSSTSVVRRRSSVRSRISIPFPAQNTTNIELKSNYSLDLTKRTIEDFKEVNILGIGAYGRVYLVKDIHTGKLYAKKSIKKAKISVDQNLLKTQRNEREILGTIIHPNIVKLFYTFHDHENIDLILEYIPGGEIFYHLEKNSRFNEDETAFYLAEVALAINHLHGLGVVYRDLKPENVLLNAKGHAILTDFGLSSIEETCHSILGTPQFIAPEVLKGEPYSYPADWWSFGIMMFDLLTGNPPFDGNSKKVIADKVLKKKLPIPHYLSLDAKDLLHKLTNKNPNKRLKIDEDFTRLTKHRFFRKIKWDQLETTTPPILPDVSELEMARNFDHNYINEILQSEERNFNKSTKTHDVEFDDSIFKGFSFIASEQTLDIHCS